MLTSSSLRVQYGSGWSDPAGWLNYDSSPTLRLERFPLFGRFVSKNSQRFPAGVIYGDIVKGLPLSSGTVSLLYCSHVLEHLALNDFHTALAESFRILAPGGTFRFVLPDLETLINDYRASDDCDAANRFMENTMLGIHSRSRGLRAVICNSLGGSKHLWMWDYKAMKKELQLAGFVDVRRAVFGDSKEQGFAGVESEDRWLQALGVECCKKV
ncbi:MAG: methyltransferase domain-containing protein [Luteolibacter sp.]